MSTVFGIFYRDICSGISLFFRFVVVSAIPFFFSWTEKRPMSQRKSCCEIRHLFRIRKAFIIISFICPIGVVEHRHEDGSIFKFFWTSLTNCHSVLNLFENLQCCPEKCSTPTQLVQFQRILCFRWTASATCCRSNLHLFFWSVQKQEAWQIVTERQFRIHITSRATSIPRDSFHVSALDVPRHGAWARKSVPQRRRRTASPGLRQRKPELSLLAAYSSAGASNISGRRHRRASTQQGKTRVSMHCTFEDQEIRESMGCRRGKVTASVHVPDQASSLPSSESGSRRDGS